MLNLVSLKTHKDVLFSFINIQNSIFIHFRDDTGKLKEAIKKKEHELMNLKDNHATEIKGMDPRKVDELKKKFSREKENLEKYISEDKERIEHFKW